MNIVALMLMLGCVTGGQDAFDAGLSATRSGDHKTAVTEFVSALESGAVDGVTYHALGNALYRRGEVGHAMAAWRRGLLLAPRDGDIAANLERVRKETKDRLDPPTTHRGAFFWQSALSPKETGVLASFLITLGLWIAVLGRFQKLRGATPVGSAVRWTMGLAIGLGVAVAGSTLDAVTQRRGAVVVAQEVEVRSALGPEGVTLFVLHEGAEVSLADGANSHTLVALADGRKGWLPDKALVSTDPGAVFPNDHR